MTSNRPYLIRALYEWIVDNDCTPHVLVHTEYPKVQIPEGYAKDGQIVLNISPNAVRQLQITNEAISFESRFGGVAHHLHIPTGAIGAIYARENGKGMVFEAEPLPVDEGPDDLGSSGKPPAPRPTAGRPSLKVIK